MPTGCKIRSLKIVHTKKKKPCPIIKGKAGFFGTG
jgi:hypothetical protein